MEILSANLSILLEILMELITEKFEESFKDYPLYSQEQESDPCVSST